MNVLKKLQNPFALVGQGFVAGGILFFATHSSIARGVADVPAIRRGGGEPRSRPAADRLKAATAAL